MGQPLSSKHEYLVKLRNNIFLIIFSRLEFVLCWPRCFLILIFCVNLLFKLLILNKDFHNFIAITTLTKNMKIKFLL